MLINPENKIIEIQLEDNFQTIYNSLENIRSYIQGNFKFNALVNKQNIFLLYSKLENISKLDMNNILENSNNRNFTIFIK